MVLVPFPYHHRKTVASVPWFDQSVKTERVTFEFIRNYAVITPVMSLPYNFSAGSTVTPTDCFMSPPRLYHLLDESRKNFNEY